MGLGAESTTLRVANVASVIALCEENVAVLESRQGRCLYSFFSLSIERGLWTYLL